MDRANVFQGTPLKQPDRPALAPVIEQFIGRHLPEPESLLTESGHELGRPIPSKRRPGGRSVTVENATGEMIEVFVRDMRIRGINEGLPGQDAHRLKQAVGLDTTPNSLNDAVQFSVRLNLSGRDANVRVQPPTDLLRPFLILDSHAEADAGGMQPAIRPEDSEDVG